MIILNKGLRVFLLILIIIIGVVIRFQYISTSIFPLNDGGLFYQMTLDLENNNLHLPKYTTYNNSYIPFAYPPLAFYFTIFLSNITSIHLMDLVRFIPFFFNILSIPAVFLLVKEISKDNWVPLLSSFIWSVSSPSYKWLIMGGGITRSMAYLFSIAALLFFARYLRKLKPIDFLACICFSALTLYSHLEIFWALILSSVVFSVLAEKLHKSWKALAFYLGGVGLISIPYIFSVLKNHGVTPFISVISSGEFNLLPSIIKILFFMFTDEYLITFIAVLAIFGIFFLLFRKDYFIFSWFMVLAIFDPRSVNRSTILPIAILAATALVNAVIPAVTNAWSIKNENSVTKLPLGLIRSPVTVVTSLLVLLILIFSFAQFSSNHNGLSSFTREDKADFEWINQNTPQLATFIVFTAEPDWQLDNIAEWFPALAQRKNLNTVQGTEWLGNNRYQSAQIEYTDLKYCTYSGVDCIKEWSEKYGYEVDYIYIKKEVCMPKYAFCTMPLIRELASDMEYSVVRDTDNSTIFQLNKD